MSRTPGEPHVTGRPYKTLHRTSDSRQCILYGRCEVGETPAQWNLNHLTQVFTKNPGYGESLVLSGRGRALKKHYFSVEIAVMA